MRPESFTFVLTNPKGGRRIGFCRRCPPPHPAGMWLVPCASANHARPLLLRLPLRLPLRRWPPPPRTPRNAPWIHHRSHHRLLSPLLPGTSLPGRARATQRSAPPAPHCLSPAFRCPLECLTRSRRPQVLCIVSRFPWFSLFSKLLVRIAPTTPRARPARSRNSVRCDSRPLVFLRGLIESIGVTCLAV